MSLKKVTNFEEDVQTSVSLTNNDIAQFRILWNIKDFRKIKNNVKHTDYIRMKQPITIFPNYLTTIVDFHPAGLNLETHTAIEFRSADEDNSCWISLKLSVLDQHREERHVFHEESKISYQRFCENWFPVNCLTVELLSNGSVQILIQGTAWKDKPMLNEERASKLLGDNTTAALAGLHSQPEHNSDIILSVEKEKFPVHKYFLASRSAVFQELFKKSTQNILVLEDVTPDVFREVLYYIYTGTMTAGCENIFPGILRFADKFELEYLKEICQIKLIAKICPDNVLEFLVYSAECNAVKLNDCCLEFIIKHRIEISKLDSWNEFKLHHAELFEPLLQRLMVYE